MGHPKFWPLRPKIFKKSKLNLLNDKVLPVEKVSYNKALKNKITVNYSAILQKP